MTSVSQALSSPKQHLGHFVCPRCHGPIVGSNGTFVTECCNCGIEACNNIVNFLGESAHIFGAVRDRYVANSIVRHKAETNAALANITTAAHEAHTTLSSVTGLSHVDLIRLEQALPLQQILNNIDDYNSDSLPTSPTISFLRRNVSLTAHSHLLDAGCSAGRHLLEFRNTGAKLTGLDIRCFGLQIGNQLWPAEANSTPTFCTADITKIPLAAESVSHIVSCVVLGLVPARAALIEFSRILAPNGQIILTVEGPGFRRELLDQTPLLDARRFGLMRWWLGQKLMEVGIDWQQHDWSRRLSRLTQYEPRTLARLLRQVGFKVEKTEVLTTYKGTPRLVGIVASKASA